MNTQAATLAAIEDRAKAAETPMYIVCARAGIAPSTFYRWKEGSDARMGKIDKITAALDAIEQEKRG